MACRYRKIKKNIPLEIFLEDEICYNDYVAISSINRMTSGGIFMLWTRSELKGRAKFLLKQNYWYSVLAALMYTFFLGNGFTYSYNILKNKNSEVETSIQGFYPILMFGIAATVAVVVVISFIVYLAIAYFLWNPMTVGCCKFFKNGRDGRQDVKDIFRMVRDCNKTVRMTMLLKTIYLTLWSLLLIVPGVIKGYEYAMVPYLLLDHPEMSRQEIFAESKRMMMGNKWDAFVLDLSFIGWHLLGACTFGILTFLYVNPYQYYTEAELYHVLRDRM